MSERRWFARWGERGGERGSFTIPAVSGIGILLLCFVIVCQFAVWIYARGALQAAAQAAVRSAAPLDSSAGSCEQAFELARSQLLGGDLGRNVGGVHCELGDVFVTLDVDATFASWLPVTPDWQTTVSAIAVREVEPG